jgi:hypothetical protein
VSDLLTPPTKQRARAVSDSDIRVALRAKLPAGEYVIMEEVSDAAGFNRSRSADALAMSLWPSRGLHLLGFEIKVNRGDWLRELKDPAKAEAIAQYCDYWIMLAPKGLIPPSELPATWGLWELDGSALRGTVQATKLNAATCSRSFLAALLRRADEANTAIVRKLIDSERDKERDAFEKRVQESVDARTSSHKELRESVARFETQSGIKIDRYTGDDVGKAVSLVLNHGDDYIVEQMRRKRDALTIALEAIDATGAMA